MKIFLSGPMRGLPRFNFPLFDAACAVLRLEGHTVFAPQENDRVLDFSPMSTEDPAPHMLQQMCLWDFRRILEADAIALLPGWQQSQGALIELAVAQRIGRRVFQVDFTVVGALLAIEPPLIKGCTS